MCANTHRVSPINLLVWLHLTKLQCLAGAPKPEPTVKKKQLQWAAESASKNQDPSPIPILVVEVAFLNLDSSAKQQIRGRKDDGLILRITRSPKSYRNCRHSSWWQEWLQTRDPPLLLMCQEHKMKQYRSLTVLRRQSKCMTTGLTHCFVCNCFREKNRLKKIEVSLHLKYH